MTLTKAHIVDAIADQIGYPKNHSSEIVETLLELIKSSLESGDNVLISRFVSKKRRNEGAEILQLETA